MVQVTNPDGTRIGEAVSPLMSVVTKNPNIDGVFVFSLGNAPGVVAANNFISLFNPLGSGISAVFAGCFVSSTSASGTTETEPLRGFRITAASAGTLQATSAIVKFDSTFPAPICQVRTANPTCTIDGAFFNTPPTISATVGSTAVHSVGSGADLGPFLLAPGEGIVLRTAAGDTDQRWNLSIVWGET